MSEVEIFNEALSAIGVRSSISLPDEQSREAEVCRLWYPTVRRLVLRAAPWHSARTASRLGLLAERSDNAAWTPDDPEPGYRFAYGQPSDLLHPNWLTTYNRFVQALYKGSQKAIMTNEPDAILIYTKDLTNVSLWDAGLRMAVVQGLASYIAMQLTGKRERSRDAQAQANDIILRARAMDANSQEDQYESIPDWIVARGYSQYNPVPRYVFPYGPLIAVAGADVI